ncbi:Uncharacterised protein [Anaerostipes hadrus]|uniref:Uncharacterized protein n=1 Tax=Anaerostipes hadrus TaxID=649756 RepID=A0A174NSI0_ANAHA|nr:hypothetical protein [Anaerostipes hadrus]CUP49817.1 Uncharacterised protein [Anaerostipes hadrus]
MKYKLTEKGKEKISEFLKECQRKREFLLKVGKDTANTTKLPIEEDILKDIDSEDHFEEDVWYTSDRYYSNEWQITDHYTSVIILKDGEHFDSIPFVGEDPECKRMANVLFNMSLDMDFDTSADSYKKELNSLEEQIQGVKDSSLYYVLMDIVENNYSGMENSKVDYEGNIVK